MLLSIYELAKNLEEKRKSKSLKKLVTNGMDDESIWQQLDLQNDENFQLNLKNVSKFLAINSEKFQLHLNDADDEDVEEEEENSSENDEVDEENIEDEEIEENSDEEQEENQLTEKKSIKKSVVDSGFFVLSEMEKFLVKEDNREMNPKDENSDDEDDVDLFENDDTNREESMKYSDFFDSVDEENDDNQEENEEENSEEESNQPKSSYELQQERLKKKIAHMENSLLDAKPWQMKGEVKADNRPQNSLLEEVLEFDSTTRPAPVITEAVTMKLEDIIRQRIKDKIFDDVVRKVKPTNVQMEYKKQLVLDQEKSKLSLAQVYEKEYIAELEKNNPDAEQEPEESKEIKEIRVEMKNLFEKLDLLSNFYYTPRPAQAELKIITNLPTISMEEVAPVAISDATLLAPEEVRRKSRGDVIGAGERTETDKNRERRHKKKFQQKKFSKEKLRGKNLVEKVVKGKNVEKMKVGENLKTSSSAFFNRLQDDINMKKNNPGEKRKKQSETHKNNAKKLKL